MLCPNMPPIGPRSQWNSWPELVYKPPNPSKKKKKKNIFKERGTLVKQIKLQRKMSKRIVGVCTNGYTDGP